MGVYFSDKGDTSKLQYVYLIIEQFLTATVVSAWLSSSHLPWKGTPTILLMVRFVDDIFLSEVGISEVFWPLFVSCVLLCVYGLLQLLKINIIHSRRSATQQMPHFFNKMCLLCTTSEGIPTLAVASQWANGWPPWWTVGNYGQNRSFYFGFLHG